MPTYQYACVDAACGNQFELVQSFSDPAASECPVCTGAVRKVYSAVGVVFKGSGFYRTDSRNTAKPAASAEKDSSSSAPSAPAAPATSSSAGADSGTSSSRSAPAKAASA